MTIEGSTGVAALLTDLPIQRTLVIELDPLGDNRFFSSLAEVRLESEGQLIEVNLP